MTSIPRNFIGVFFVALLLLGVFSIFPTLSYAQLSETPAQKEARLRAELAQVEKEQAETEKILAQAKGQSASLARDILILDTKIKAAQLNIKAKNLKIESLGKDIVKKQEKINDLESHINRGKETLAQIMRKTNETDSFTMAEFILAREDLAEFFSDLDTFESVQQGLKITFEEIRAHKTQTQGEKETLSKRKNQESDARAVIESEKKNIQKDEAEKRALLKASKGNEQTYSQVLLQKKAQAAAIRAALFPLAGGSVSIRFDVALELAKKASKITGIRPAFLLAVIKQESDFGANVGNCLVTDITTGDGAGKNTGTAFEQVMKAPRDTLPFKNITESLGLDWKTTPVSCPIGNKLNSGTKYYVGRGFGGAMGPAQFIPSTWELFKKRIATAFGITTPSPWNNEHAFTASAFYLTDLGAVSGSYTGEIKAACSYFGSGGATCSYGEQVRVKADTIQRTMIDPLQGL